MAEWESELESGVFFFCALMSETPILTHAEKLKAKRDENVKRKKEQEDKDKADAEERALLAKREKEAEAIRKAEEERSKADAVERSQLANEGLDGVAGLGERMWRCDRYRETLRLRADALERWKAVSVRVGPEFAGEIVKWMEEVAVGWTEEDGLPKAYQPEEMALAAYQEEDNMDAEAAEDEAKAARVEKARADKAAESEKGKSAAGPSGKRSLPESESSSEDENENAEVVQVLASQPQVVREPEEPRHKRRRTRRTAEVVVRRPGSPEVPGEVDWVSVFRVPFVGVG
jgi:hypothetical protein